MYARTAFLIPPTTVDSEMSRKKTAARIMIRRINTSRNERARNFATNTTAKIATTAAKTVIPPIVFEMNNCI